MPELIIHVWLKEPSITSYIRWDGLIGTLEEIEKYKAHLRSWMVDWTPGNLIEIETEETTYIVNYDCIELIELNVRELI